MGGMEAYLVKVANYATGHEVTKARSHILPETQQHYSAIDTPVATSQLPVSDTLPPSTRASPGEVPSPCEVLRWISILSGLCTIAVAGGDYFRKPVHTL